MSTGGRNHIPSLDGIRAVSILLVFVGHSERLPAYIRPSLGVTIFFFLSGYLITTLLRIEADNKNRIDIRDFYLRRIFRIWPALYLVIILGILVTMAGIVPGDVSLAGITASGLQVTNYWLIFDGTGVPKAMRVLWSLAVEEHFYLFFPVIYVALRKWVPNRMHQGLILAALCLVILGWRAYLSYGLDVGYFNRIYMGTDTRADSILWGCVLAIVANPFLDKIRGHRNLWVWVGIPVAVVGLYVTQRAGDSWQPIVLTVQALLVWVILTAVVSFPNSIAGRVLNWKPVAFLGVMSYSFYLVHRYFILWADEHMADVNRFVVAALTFSASLGTAYLIHRYVEKPFLKAKKRLTKAKVG